MSKYEAALKAIDLLARLVYNQSIRNYPDHSVILRHQKQIDKLTDSLIDNGE